MRKNTKKSKVPVEVEFTDGYQERFTAAVLKIYSNRIKKADVGFGEQDRKIYGSLSECQQVKVS